jgi:hydroxymethylglutaryl-CoA lyase
MADNASVYRGIEKHPDIAYPVLVPNLKGYYDAKAAGAQEIAVFVSAGEGFSRANINCTVEESLRRSKEVIDAALMDGIAVRGYISCVFADPFIGPTPPEDVLKVAKALHEMGCHELSLGDTTGVGTPGDTHKLLRVLVNELPREKLAMHFHDTYGQALANTVVGLQMGLNIIDSSVAGLGGCPFSPGATGNVSTEDVVYMLHGMGIETGVDMEKLIEAGEYISSYLERPPNSRVSTATRSRQRREAEEKMQKEAELKAKIQAEIQAANSSRLSEKKADM